MPTPADQQQAVLDGLNRRLEQALTGFDKLNEYADNGNYAPPWDWRLLGGMTALTEILVATGLVSDKDVAILTAMKQCGILEQSLAEGREHLRQETGIIAPVGPAGRPQG